MLYTYLVQLIASEYMHMVAENIDRAVCRREIRVLDHLACSLQPELVVICF